MSNQNDKQFVYKDLTLYDIKAYCKSKDTSHLKGAGANQIAYHLYSMEDCPQVGWKALRLLDIKLFNKKRAYSYKKAFHQKQGYLWDGISKNLPNVVVGNSFYTGLEKCIEQHSDLPYYREFYEDYFIKFNVDSIIDFFYTLPEEKKEMAKKLLAAAVQYYRDEVYHKELQWKKDNKRQLKRDAKKKKKLDKKQDRSAMTEKERLLFAKLHDKRKAQDEAFCDFTARNIRKNLAEKYSEEAHFIYELLQNADDAGATYAKFELHEDKLLFRHNGKPFSISEDVEDAKPYGDINSITAPAYSAKQEDHQKIGKFGVGFKAVYIYTNEPEIYSGVFNFKIIHQIVPELITNCIYPKEEKETLFVLRFKDIERDRKVIENKLKALESPLLFLNNLKSIEWTIQARESHEYTKSNEYINTIGEVALNKVEETNDGSFVRYYMLSKTVDLGEHGKHRIFAGFPLTESGMLDVYNKIQKVYCFFPTKTCYGMVAKLQAPFLLNESREQVLSYEDINIRLKKELASLMASSLEILCKIGLISDNLIYIIPYGYHPTDRWGNNYTGRGVTEDIKEFYDAFNTCLKEKKVFPTKEGHYESYRHVMFTSAKMKDLITKTQLNMLMGRTDNALDFLSFEVNGDFEKYLEDTIGLKEFKTEDLVHKIDTQFMQKQTSAWIEDLYKYVKFLKTFRYCSFVKTNKGDYESLYLEDGEVNLFAPIGDTTNDNISMTFIDADTYQLHKLYFDMMGVQKPDEIDYLSQLLNRYEDAKGISDQEIISDLNNILKIRSKYSGTPKLADIDTILKKKFKVKVLDKNGSAMANILEVFIPNRILSTYNIQTKSTRKELDVSFYTQFGVNENKLYNLTRELGGLDKGQINIVCYGNNDVDEHEVTAEDRSTFVVIEKSKSDLSPYLKSIVDQIGNLQELFEVYDYDIVNIEETNIDKDMSVALWNYILQYSSDSVCKSKLYYRVWHGSKWYKYLFESSLLYKLKTSAWIVKEDGTHVRPTAIKKDDFHQLGYENNEDWEDTIHLAETVTAQEEAQRLEDSRNISNMWNDDPLEASKWAKFRDLCNSKGITLNELSSKLELIEDMSDLGDDNEDKAENTQNYSDADTYQDDLGDLVPPSLVRKTEHYIGIKLYEGLLKKKGISFQVPVSHNGGYDIKIMPEKLVKISVVKDKEINKEKFAPIGISSDQHRYMNFSNTNKFTMIRIALGDLGLDFDKEIRDIFGADADIENDELFRKKCDKFVTDYWKGKSIEDFENMTSEYSIRIYREL